MKPPEAPNNVPLVMEGLTSIAGILAGFSTFILSYKLQVSEDRALKKWLQDRIAITVFFLFFTFFPIISSYRELVDNNYGNSFKLLVMGVLLTLVLFLRTFAIISVEKEDIL
jgi:hypothetical protein